MASKLSLTSVSGTEHLDVCEAIKVTDTYFFATFPRPPHNYFLTDCQGIASMSHDTVYYSHPRTYGKGSRGW